MKKIFASSLFPCAALLALGAVACSQGPGDEAASAAANDALIGASCAFARPNAKAPASGNATYVAVGAQYGQSACGAYTVDVNASSRLHVTAALAGAKTISAAQCANISAELSLVDFWSVINDCSELKKPCKPSTARGTEVVAKTRVGAVMVQTPTGPQCELPTAVLDTSWGLIFNDSDQFKLLASAHLGGPAPAYEDLVLNVTTQ